MCKKRKEFKENETLNNHAQKIEMTKAEQEKKTKCNQKKKQKKKNKKIQKLDAKEEVGSDSNNSTPSSDTEASDNSLTHSPDVSSGDEEQDGYDSDFELELKKFKQRLDNIHNQESKLTPQVSEDWIRNIQL